jgi:Orsellinic acid/F9775 biosynthesis cluster protein D
MNAYVHFNQEHNVLICKVHQYAVSSKFLARHFLEEHDLDIKIRQDIITYASQFTTAKPSQILYSLDNVILVPYLSIITGFRCQYEGCAKILGTLASVKHHCKVDHDWKAKDGTKWVETRAQTFFQGYLKRYMDYTKGKLIL